jgi:aminoacrylate hydrolase
MPRLAREGADIFYEVHGKGSPILMMSGTAGDGEFWKPCQVPEFSRDFAAITYDQRGTGKTVTRADGYTTETLADDAAALIERVGLGPAIVWGHSMGGRVAQLVALDHPKKVAKLILSSTGASFKSKGGIPPAICLELVEKGYERYVREHSTAIGFSKAFANAHPDKVEAFIKARLATQPPLKTYLAHIVARQEHDTSARLKDIRAPTLVTVGGDEGHGNSDTTHIQSSEALARAIPGAKFIVIPGAGHFYPFSDPETTNRLVRDFVEGKA